MPGNNEYNIPILTVMGKDQLKAITNSGTPTFVNCGTTDKPDVRLAFTKGIKIFCPYCAFAGYLTSNKMKVTAFDQHFCKYHNGENVWSTLDKAPSNNFTNLPSQHGMVSQI